MKWKHLGLALVLLVLPSWYLLGADSSNPTVQPAAWQATQGPEFLPNSTWPFPELRLLPRCEEPPRPTVESSGFSPQHAPGPFGAPSWNEAGGALQLSNGMRPCSEVPAALPNVERVGECVERDRGFGSPVPESLGRIAPASYSASSTGPADGARWLPTPVSGPADGPVRFTPSREEPDEMDFRFLNESGEAAGDIPFITQAVPPHRDVFAARFGWWLVDANGSPTKVAEYEGLGSSPFADVDGLFSDGLRTVNLSGTFLDNETSQAGLDYFGPRLSADFDLQRYLHRLDHDPLANMGSMTSGEETIKEDLNVGEDYVVRVEDVRTSFEGRLTEHVKARFNFRSLRKHGERQANAMQHCFCEIRQNNCHVVSQRQEIDWQTVKFEPVIEAKFGPVRAEYSRPMRVFSQDDQLVTRRFYLYGPHFPIERDYASVPENFSQVDRLKLAVDLAAQTDLYAKLSAGDTENKYRDTHRKFQVYDLRLTNRTWDGLTLTGYITLNKQTNESPPFLLPEEMAALSVPNAWVPPYGIRHPVDYSTTMAGAEASWQPFRTSSFAKGLSFTAGCEEGSLDRKFADYFIEDPQIVVDQEHTLVTSGHVGASMRFSQRLDTRMRYKFRSVQDPLFGINRYEGTTNTSLPEDQHLVEIGGTWRPLNNFTANVTVGMENRTHHSEIADFDESSLPMTFSLWYAPTPAWSFSAGYGFYSNWIEQDILFPSDAPQAETWNRSRWDYDGRFRVLSVGAAYVWTPKITLSGGLQLVSANNAFDPLAPWPDLPLYSEVVVDTTRVTAGVDWQLRERISAYFRYRFEEYLDKSAGYNSGTAHMSLVGLSGVY
jgi:hypothetical protein